MSCVSIRIPRGQCVRPLSICSVKDASLVEAKPSILDAVHVVGLNVEQSEASLLM